MIEQHRRPANWNAAEQGRLFAEIACLTSAAQAGSVRQVLDRVLTAAWKIIGLARGSVSILDYVSGRYYGIDDAGVPRSEMVGPEPQRFYADPLPPPWGEPSKLVRSGDNGLIALPLTAGSQQLGLLLILRDTETAVCEEQLELLRGLASLAALAIDRGRRESGGARLQDWLGALANSFDADTRDRIPRAADEIALLLQAIADDARRISRCTFVTLYEYFAELDDVRIPPTISGPMHDDEVLRGRSVAAEHKQSLIFRTLNLPHPIFADHPATWVEEGLIAPQALGEERSFFRREGVASSVGIPLRTENERVGVLFINYRDERSFSPEFQQHLEHFASQAAREISNARVYLRSRRYSDNLEVVNLIGRELGLAVSLDIEQIGQLIYDLIQSVIPTKNLFLALYDAQHERYELPFIRDDHDSAETLLSGLPSGLTGYVCRSRQPLLATPEVKEKLVASGEVRPIGHASAVWLGAPLMVRNKVIGVIAIQDYRDQAAFRAEHRELLTAIASQAATAIDNSRLLWKTKQQLQELRALLDLSQAFSAGKPSTEILSAILDHVSRLAHCDGSLLLLVEPGDDDLRIAATSEKLAPYTNRTLRAGEGLSGRLLTTKQPTIVNDYSQWPERSTLFEPPPEHVCAAPMIWNDRVIGVMTLSSDRKDRRFSEREIEILQRFAGPAAVAVQNARDGSFRQALIDAGPYAIVAVDRGGSITEFNEEASRLFGYRKEEVIGESVLKLYAGTREEAEALQNSILTGEKIEEKEVFGRSRTGEEVPLTLTAVLLREENGDVRGCLGIVEDLRIQSLRGRTQLLVEALREISAGEDLEAIAHRIVDSARALAYADAGCLVLLGDGTVEVKASQGHDEELLRVLSDDHAGERWRRFAAEGQERIAFLSDAEIEGLRLRPDARSCVLVPIRTDTKLLGFLVVQSGKAGHFNADQKLLEVIASQAAVSINRVQLMRYREEMERGLYIAQNAISVGQIATTFLHEAKNSLSGIKLTIESLQDDIEEAELKNKKEYTERLQAVLSEVARFDTLSRRLQRFTKQGLQPVKKEVYLNDIVNQTLVLLGSALRGQEMKVEAKLDASLDRPAHGTGNPVLADEDQVQQVLMNLILNAIAASGRRRPLVVETRNLGVQVEIRVTDHGTGIKSEVLKKLFIPFYSTKIDGVGLGLFLSKILMEKNHGGEIKILNTIPGKGSTFAVRLPRVTAG
jgi:PAS domain S-box-containing protein